MMMAQASTWSVGKLVRLIEEIIRPRRVGTAMVGGGARQVGRGKGGPNTMKPVAAMAARARNAGRRSPIRASSPVLFGQKVNGEMGPSPLLGSRGRNRRRPAPASPAVSDCRAAGWYLVND